MKISNILDYGVMMAIKSGHKYIQRAEKKNKKVEFLSYLGSDGGLYFQLGKQNRKVTENPGQTKV